MTEKEAENLAVDFLTYFSIVKEVNDPAEAANQATDMIKTIIKRSKKIRASICDYEGGFELLDELNIDYD